MLRLTSLFFVVFFSSHSFAETIPSANTRVAEEMAKHRAVNAQWFKERTLFYVSDLNVTRQELSAIENSTDKYGEAIKKIADILEKAPGQIFDDEIPAKVKSALDQHEKEILNILGQERLDRAKAFRQAFNEKVMARFGTGAKFSAF